MTTIDLSTLDGADGFRIADSTAEQSAGSTVSIGGDLNGNQHADVVIGSEPSVASSSFVIFGKGTGFAADILVNALNGADGFRADHSGLAGAGSSGVAGIGDINGDTLDDMAAGLPTASPDLRGGAGSTHVIFGDQASLSAVVNTTTLNAASGFTIDGETASDASGTAVARAGDMNGDGIGDIVIGAVGSGLAGGAFVVFGSTSGLGDMALDALDGVDGFQINGAAIADGVGVAASTAGDFNGDGLADLLIGAPSVDNGLDLTAGAAYLLYGKESGFDATFDLATLDASDGFVISGGGTTATLGAAVSTAGDINGDGKADIIIGAPLAAGPAGADAGKVFVILGSDSIGATLDVSTLDGTDGFRLDGSSGSGKAGNAFSAAGDLNGDGLADIIIGSEAAASGRGEAHILFGKSDGFASSIDLSCLADADGISISGIGSLDNLGASVGGGGDVNGDGFDDVIIGAPGHNNGLILNVGESYVIFGFDGGAVTHNGIGSSAEFVGEDRADIAVLGEDDDTFNSGLGDDVIRAGAGDDIGDLGDGNNMGDGGDGNDTINGGAGDDVLHGGRGADTLLLGTGADEVFGEEGNDTFSARHDELGAGDRIFGGEGTADKLVVTSNGLLDLTLLDAFVGVEQVTLQVEQTAIGSDANILWNGRGGAEDFTLGAGRDLVKAGHGNDIVRGGDGADILLGHTGNDRLIGQAGTDRMKGGSGDDVIVATVGSGLDIVYDFTVGEDKVDVSGLGFTDFEIEVGSIWRTVNGKALMEMGGGDRLLLVGVDHTTLTADDFILA